MKALRSIIIAIGLLFVSLLALTIIKPATAQSSLANAMKIVDCSKSGACLGYHNKGSGAGLLGASDNSAAIIGRSYAPYGVAYSLDAAIQGEDRGQGRNGVSGLSLHGNGGYFKTVSGLNALIAESDYKSTSNPHSTFLVLGNVNSTPEVLIGSRGTSAGYTVGNFDDATGKYIFYFTRTGDLHILGNIYTGGSCSTGCFPTGTVNGKQLQTYAPRQSVPSVDDVGEAQLVRGSAYVRLDPAFASTTNSRAPYLVFITPQGETEGLFVTSKSSAGFWVKENRHGASTVPFDYRIVASPLSPPGLRLSTYTQARGPDTPRI